MRKERLERQLASLPLYQYAFLKTKDLVFTQRVRHICRTECSMYGKTWACPPAVGSLEACREKCLTYPEVLMICTAPEVEDTSDLEQTLQTRKNHEAVTDQVVQMMRDAGFETMALSTEACQICESCTYPTAPCRHPEKMHPCVESYGILVTELYETCAMEFMNGSFVVWVSLIFFR